MKNVAKIHCASLAACCALLLAPGAIAHAQSSKSRPIASSGAKTSREQPKTDEPSEHRALSRAHQIAINQASWLEQYVDEHAGKIDRSAMNRSSDAIARALDDAQEHRQNLEASVPSGSSAADQFQIVRDREQGAAEHYRSLVQEAAKTDPDRGALKAAADDIVKELKQAEAAHKKTF